MKEKTIETMIKIITNPNTDYKAIALKLASLNPEMFVDCSLLISEKPSETSSETSSPTLSLSNIEKEVLRDLCEGGFCTAIRNYRIKYNLSLVDAKNAVMEMRKEFRKLYLIPLIPNHPFDNYTPLIMPAK